MGQLCGLRVCCSRRILSALLIFLAFASTCLGIGEIIYAVNCGGNAHVDVYGIHYQRDPLTIGTSSEHGKVLTIRRVFSQDQILYQTERYHTDNFEYSIPIRSDGDYVLVMKFSEVWFTEPNRKVFSVQLNEQHLVVDNLDIFATVGLGVAHDEIVPFSVKNGQLHVNKETSDFDGFLNVEFVKLQMDNPKINAIYVMKGTLKDVPMLPSIPSPSHQGTDDEDEEEIQEKSQQSHRKRRPVSETKVSDPYATEDPSSMLLPVIIAIAAFVPIVFCLCKL